MMIQQEHTMKMKRRLPILWVTALLGLVAAALAWPAGAVAQTTVTGTGAGVFPAGGEYEGLTLSSATFGHGLVINADGTASGDFHSDLAGTTPQGSAGRSRSQASWRRAPPTRTVA